MNHAESVLQTKICRWLKDNYPGIIFFSDFAAGLYFKEDWVKNLRSLQACEDKYLDLTIMSRNKTFSAIIIEIKVNVSDLFLIDGRTLKSSHVQEQYNSILKLREQGYYADFGVGENDIKQIIINYFNDNCDYKEVKPFRGTMAIDKGNLAADNFFAKFDL